MIIAYIIFAVAFLSVLYMEVILRPRIHKAGDFCRWVVKTAFNMPDPHDSELVKHKGVLIDHLVNRKNRKLWYNPFCSLELGSFFNHAEIELLLRGTPNELKKDQISQAREIVDKMNERYGKDS